MGWVELVGCIALIPALLIVTAFYGMNVTLVLKAAIFVPFGIWWGLRQIRKYRSEPPQS